MMEKGALFFVYKSCLGNASQAAYPRNRHVVLPIIHCEQGD